MNDKESHEWSYGGKSVSFFFWTVTVHKSAASILRSVAKQLGISVTTSSKSLYVYKCFESKIEMCCELNVECDCLKKSSACLGADKAVDCSHCVVRSKHDKIKMCNSIFFQNIEGATSCKWVSLSPQRNKKKVFISTGSAKTRSTLPPEEPYTLAH